MAFTCRLVVIQSQAARCWGPPSSSVCRSTPVTEAEVINPSVVDYAIAGPTFETPSKPGYGPEIGRKGVARIARAAPVPVLAIGGLNATRAAEVLAAGPVGIAVMGGVMRAADPGQVVRALACDHCRSSSLAVGNLPEAVATP
jgi:thiamine monophosphate synthase